MAISLCSDEERGLLKDIQKVTRQTIPTFDRRNDTRLGQAAAMADKLVPKDAGKGEDPIYGQKQGQRGPRGESHGQRGRHGHGGGGRPQGQPGHGHAKGRGQHDGQHAGSSGEARGETQGRGGGPNRNRRRRPGGGGGAKTPMSGSWSPSVG
jgi:ATP-dependent RNA helicase RhlE